MKITKNGVSFDVDPSRYGWFWNLILGQAWEEETFRIFDRFLDPEHTCLDIGAWIGPTTLYAAHRAKHVFAIEPDIVAYYELAQNLALNPTLIPKVTPAQCALTAKSGTTRLYTRTHPGDSSSSIIPTLSDDDFCEVNGVTIREFISKHQVTDVNFVKMDIEAGEYFLIPAMQKFLKQAKPVLYLSLHPQFLREEVELKTAQGGFYDLEESTLLDRPLALTKKLLDSLAFYKYIYDVAGNLVDRNAILAVPDLGQFVFTDELW